MGKLYIPNSIALRNFDSIFTNNDFDFSDGQADIGFHPNYFDGLNDNNAVHLQLRKAILQKEPQIPRHTFDPEK